MPYCQFLEMGCNTWAATSDRLRLHEASCRYNPRPPATLEPASTNSLPTRVELPWDRPRPRTRTGRTRTLSSNAVRSGRSTRPTTRATRYGTSRSSEPNTLPSPGLNTSSLSELTPLLDSMMEQLDPSTPKPNDTALDLTLVRLGLAVHRRPCISGHANGCIHRKMFRAWLWMLSREGRLNFLPRFDEWMTLDNRLSSRPTPSEMLSKWRKRLLRVAEEIGGQAIGTIA